MMEQASRFVRNFEAAWTARDGDAMRVLWHPDGKLYTPIVARPVSPDELPQLVSLQIKASPDLRWHLLGWAASGTIVYVEWKTSQTVLGVAMEWRGMDRFVLDGEGRILEERVFADTAPFRAVRDETARHLAVDASRIGVSPDAFFRL